MKEKGIKLNQLNAGIKKKQMNQKFASSVGQFAYLFIMLFSIIVYMQTFDFDFVNFDDDVIIVNNYYNLGDFSKIGQTLTTDAYFQHKSNYYRPLLTMSFMLDAQIGGNKAFIYHITNLLLHCLVCCALFYLFKLFKFNVLPALAAALIFTVHPLFANTVAWIPARNDLLVSLFFLVSFIFYIKYDESQKTYFYILHLLAFLFTVFSKELGLLLPAVFILYSILIRNKKIFDRSALKFYTSWVLIIILFFIMRNQAIQGFPGSDVLSPLLIFEKFRTLPELISKFFVPFGLSPIPMFGAFHSILGGILLLALLSIIYYKRKSDNFKMIFFGFLWLLIIILPGMFTSQGKDMFDYLECRAYLPMAGMLVMLMTLIPVKWEADYLKRFWMFSIILVGLLSGLNYFHTRIFKNPDTFYNFAVAGSPNSAIAYSNRGLLRNASGDYRGALEDYSRSLKLNPNQAQVYNNRGITRNELRDYNGAIKDFKKALSLNNKLAETYTNLGISMYNLRDFAAAASYFGKTIELNPGIPEAFNNRAGAYFNMKEYEKAISDYNKALSINPKYSDALNNRATIKSIIGDKNGACNDWRLASELGNQSARKMLEKYCK